MPRCDTETACIKHLNDFSPYLKAMAVRITFVAAKTVARNTLKPRMDTTQLDLNYNPIYMMSNSLYFSIQFGKMKIWMPSFKRQIERKVSAQAAIRQIKNFLFGKIPYKVNNLKSE
jgi:hypothetical protein